MNLQKEEESYSESQQEAFARAVKSGMTSNPKSISSKYFYDKTGDQLFSRIMDLPEYYLSRTELDILQQNRKEILADIVAEGSKMTLVELGAGDGTKTKILIGYLVETNTNFRYVPVDISANVLRLLKSSLQKNFPDIRINEICKDYFDALQLLRTDFTPKLVLFLGSNIGNYSKAEAENFLQLLKTRLNFHDQVLIGFDLKKDPAIIYKAYNDSAGVTRQFNLNLLRRINTELGGNFDLNQFMHYPTYDPATGEMKSFLLSTCKQTVLIRSLKMEVSFDAWEPVFTEVSMKYSLTEIRQMLTKCGLVIEKEFSDPDSQCVNVLMRKKDAMRDAHHPRN